MKFIVERGEKGVGQSAKFILRLFLPGFKTAYAQMENGRLLRVIYFREENKLPNNPPDDESVYWHPG